MVTVLHSAVGLSDGNRVDGLWLRVEDGRIAALGSGDGWRGGAEAAGTGTSVIDLAGGYLTPGFVDMHCHGGGGAPFGGTLDQARTAVSAHRRHGTTRVVASLVSAPEPNLIDQLAGIADWLPELPGLLGSHLEGPFLDSGHRGAHDPGALRSPDPDTVDRLLAAARGTLRQLTIAPELDGAPSAIRQLSGHGVTVAVGHTGADYGQTVAAFAAGATLLTHAFNAMPGIHHRAPGPVAAALDDDRVTLELVADGHHVLPAAMRLLTRSAPGRVALVSDAMAAAAAEDGDYTLGALAVTVRGGVATVACTDTIAGSTLTLDAALRRAVHEVGLSVQEAVASVTAVPAAALGVADRYGSLRVGRTADLVLLDADLLVDRVWFEGDEVV